MWPKWKVLGNDREGLRGEGGGRLSVVGYLVGSYLPSPFFDLQCVRCDLMLPHLCAALVEPELEPYVPAGLPTGSEPVERTLP